MIIKVIVAVGILLLVGWISWASLGIIEATPQSKYDAHIIRADEKFDAIQTEIMRQRESIEEKLDAIQEKL